MSLKFIILVTFLVFINHTIASKQTPDDKSTPKESSSTESDKEMDKPKSIPVNPRRTKDVTPKKYTSNRRKPYAIQYSSVRCFMPGGKGIEINDNPQEDAEKKSKAQVMSFKKGKEAVSKAMKSHLDKSQLKGPVSLNRPFTPGEKLGRQFSGFEPVMSTKNPQKGIQIHENPEESVRPERRTQLRSRKGKELISEDTEDPQHKIKKKKDIFSIPQKKESTYSQAMQKHLNRLLIQHLATSMRTNPQYPVDNISHMATWPHESLNPHSQFLFDDINQTGVSSQTHSQFPFHDMSQTKILSHESFQQHPQYPHHEISHFEVSPYEFLDPHSQFPLHEINQAEGLSLQTHSQFPLNEINQAALSLQAQSQLPFYDRNQTELLSLGSFQQHPPQYPHDGMGHFGISSHESLSPHTQPAPHEMPHLRILTRPTSPGTSSQHISDWREVQTARSWRPQNDNVKDDLYSNSELADLVRFGLSGPPKKE